MSYRAYDRRTSRRGSATTVALWGIFGVSLIAFGANFFGPMSGYLDFLRGNTAVVDEPVVETDDPDKPTDPEDKDNPGSEVAGTDKGPTITEEPVNQQPETKEPKDTSPTVDQAKKGKYTLIAEYKEKILSELEKPKVGEVISVKLKNGDRIKGTLKVIGNFAVLESSSGRKVEIKPEDVGEDGMKTLFPKLYAKDKATEMAENEIANRPKEPEVVNVNTKEPTFDKGPGGRSELFDVNGHPKSKLIKYDPTFAKSPKELQKAMEKYLEWVNLRQRQIGGTIVNKMWAKRYSSNVVLFIEMNKGFTTQDSTVRESVAKQFQYIWGQHLKNFYKKNIMYKQSHLVLLDETHRIVGGSTPSNASKTWVK